jgi:hypothetical protein
MAESQRRGCSVTMRDVTRAEAVWIRIIGVLLILLGVTLFASPRVAYTRRERIPHSAYTIKREKTILVPRPAAVLIVGTGVMALIAARKSGGAPSGG